MSRSCLNRESRSPQFEKGLLDSRDFLDSLKNDISTIKIFSTVQKPSLDSLDYPKIDFCLDLDSLKKDILTCQDISISIALDCRDPQA